MIFLDANVFIRYLTEPTDAKARQMNAIATALFVAVEQDE